MKNKYLFVIMLLSCMALAGFGFTKVYTSLEKQEEGEELIIVTSFYPMYVAVLNIAGDCKGVTVENLSENQTGCLHDYQLTPQDMLLLSEADIFVINGGGMESFLSDVAEEYPQLTIINAGASLLEEDGQEENAHIWMSISRYKEQVLAIGEGLTRVDSPHQKEYKQGMEAYLEQIEALQEKAEKLKERLQGTEVILFHEAFEYLAEDFGLQTAGELDLDEERKVSARETADILKTIEQKNVSMILAEDLYGKDMGDTIERETDCKVYYLDTLVQGDGSADSWLLGMEQNIQSLQTAFDAMEAAKGK